MAADRDYIEKLRGRLKVKADEESKKPVVCDGCRRAAISDTGSFVPLALEEINAASWLTDKAKEAMHSLSEYGIMLGEKYRGRIVQHQGAEWVIRWVSGHVHGRSEHDGVTVSLSKLNKRQPWELTNTDCTVRLEELLISAATIEQRKAAAKGVK